GPGRDLYFASKHELTNRRGTAIIAPRGVGGARPRFGDFSFPIPVKNLLADLDRIPLLRGTVRVPVACRVTPFEVSLKGKVEQVEAKGVTCRSGGRDFAPGLKAWRITGPEGHRLFWRVLKPDGTNDIEGREIIGRQPISPAGLLSPQRLSCKLVRITWRDLPFVLRDIPLRQ